MEDKSETTPETIKLNPRNIQLIEKIGDYANSEQSLVHNGKDLAAVYRLSLAYLQMMDLRTERPNLKESATLKWRLTSDEEKLDTAIRKAERWATEGFLDDPIGQDFLHFHNSTITPHGRMTPNHTKTSTIRDMLKKGLGHFDQQLTKDN